MVLVNPVGTFDVLLGGQAPEALRKAVAYDDDFLSARAPVLWSTLATSLVIHA